MDSIHQNQTWELVELPCKRICYAEACCVNTEYIQFENKTVRYTQNTQKTQRWRWRGRDRESRQQTTQIENNALYIHYALCATLPVPPVPCPVNQQFLCLCSFWLQFRCLCPFSHSCVVHRDAKCQSFR